LSLITEELETMARVKDQDKIESKRKALVTLFPYAVRLERGGDRRMFDAYFDIFMVPGAGEFVFRPIFRLLDGASPSSPNWAVTLMLPFARWGLSRCDPNSVTGWVGAVLAVSHTERVAQNVIEWLLWFARDPSLQPFIPVSVWVLLKKRPSLPPTSNALFLGTQVHVVRRVRRLGDVELLVSYFHVVWSEWNPMWPDDFCEMCTSIREDLGEFGMWNHREVLIKRLDHILGELDRGLEHFRQQRPWLKEDDIQRWSGRYRELKNVLLEVDRKTSEILTRTPFRSTNLFGLLTPADIRRIPLDLHLCTPSPLSVVVRPQHLLLTLLSHTGSPQSPHRPTPKNICVPLVVPPDVKKIRRIDTLGRNRVSRRTCIIVFYY